MKYVLIFIVPSLIHMVYAQNMSFEPAFVDYGSLKKGGDGTRKIKITNTGDKPLIISNVKTGCGCAISQWTKTPIVPKGIGEIVFKYDTNKIGVFNKSVEVFSNDVVAQRRVIKIKGRVE